MTAVTVDSDGLVTVAAESFADAVVKEWRLNPDGTMQLELRHSTGYTFWRGTFRPAEEASHADA